MRIPNGRAELLIGIVEAACDANGAIDVVSCTIETREGKHLPWECDVAFWFRVKVGVRVFLVPATIADIVIRDKGCDLTRLADMAIGMALDQARRAEEGAT